MEFGSGPGIMELSPPRLEDAGLEDSALPTAAIQEAFKRAAGALHQAQRQVQSTATGILGNVHPPDAVKGAWEESWIDHKGQAALGEKQSCVDTKAGGVALGGHDKVIAPSAGQVEGDKVVVGKDSGPKLGDTGCVEGLAGLKGEEKGPRKEDEEDGPILVLG